MGANVLNILIEQGTSFSRKLEFKNSSQVAINLTGCSFRGSVRTKANSTDVLGSFTFDILAPATDGVVMMTMPANETSLLPTNGVNYQQLSKYTYDVEMIDSNGIVTRILNGDLSVSPEVTK